MYTMVVIFLAILLLIAILSPIRRKKKSNLVWERKSTLWFQELIKRFQDRFPDQPFHIDESNPYIIVIPPKHPVVGELRICDGGNNIIVEIGPFTHEHFDKTGLWDAEQSNWEDVRGAMVWDVLSFVEEILEDKIEFYGKPPSDYMIHGGGHQERGKKPRGFLNILLCGKATYVWSGPIEEQ